MGGGQGDCWGSRGSERKESAPGNTASEGRGGIRRRAGAQPEPCLPSAWTEGHSGSEGQTMGPAEPVREGVWASWETSWRRQRCRGVYHVLMSRAQHGAGAGSSPLGGSPASPSPLEPLALSRPTQGALEQGAAAEPHLASARALGASGVRISPPSGNARSSGAHSTQWERGSMLTRTFTDTHSHRDAHGGSQTRTPRHMPPGGWGSRRTLQLWPLGGAISNEPLCWSPPPHPTGVPPGARPAGCGDPATGHSSVSLVQTLTAHPPSPDTFYLITCHC